MIGDRSALINYEKCSREHVTFVDGIKNHVLRQGTSNVGDFPGLENVLHVEDMKAHLLSISQIYDQNLMVDFDSNKCQVPNNKGKCIFKGIRSSNHYFKLI